jgi:hypothetical protein
MRRCGQANEVVLATIVTRMSNLGYLLSRFSRFPLFLVCAGFSAFVLMLCVLAGAQFKRNTEWVFYRQTENIAQMLLAGFEGDTERVDAILTQIAALTSDLDISPTNATAAPVADLLYGASIDHWTRHRRPERHIDRQRHRRSRPKPVVEGAQDISGPCRQPGRIEIIH